MDIAGRLRAKLNEMDMSESELARRSGVPQPTINRILSGESSSPRKNTVEPISRALRVTPDWLLFGGEEFRNDGAPSDRDYALIPQYKAHASCGEGYLNDHVEVTDGLAFKREWLARMRAKPEHLRIIYAEGDSMEPYIFEGDVVLFDSSKIEPKDRQAYVLRRPDGGISIKRLIQQITGGWLIRSDNADKTKYPDEPVSEEALDDVPIIGRVIWRGGEM